MAIDNQVVNAAARLRWIEMLQKQLIRENPSALPNHGVDGVYGSETTDWVTRFQERKGLQVDGIAGPETLGRLREDIVQRPDTSGRGVELLQEDLLWFYIQQSAVDGIYGPGTTQGVRDFQFLNNLVVDGVAGPSTLKRMDEQITKIIVQEGDSGSIVRRIQNQLNDQDEVDISIEVDGSFGPATKKAVEDFQNATAQGVDGIAGPVTLNLLDQEAYHPLTEEEIEQIFADYGYEIHVTAINDEGELVDILQSSNAFSSNIPDNANNSISDAEAYELSTSHNSFEQGLYQLQGSLETTTSGYVAFTALFDEAKELIGITFMIVDGDLYDSAATQITYDIDGDEVEKVEDTTIEFINEELEGQKAITEYMTPLMNRNEDDVHAQVEDVCDALVSLGVGTACGSIGLLVSGITAGIAALIAGSACSTLHAWVTDDGRCS
ncbi:MAG: Peptidoglycan-binding protein [Shouchella clausii]|jgi:peptidoglycan hydrolase-like protein with peptidoglycan-binding domain